MNSFSSAPDYTGQNSPATRITKIMPIELAGKRIDQALAVLFPDYSRNRLQQWIREGFVTLNGNPCNAKHKVWGGEVARIDVQPAAEELAFRAEDIRLETVYEDTDLIVIEKPAGLVVHPGSGNWSGTLLNALLQRCPANATLPRAGIVHRLDKDTSGLLVAAKSLRAHTSLVRQLQAREVRRQYLAIVHGELRNNGTIEAAIGRHPRDRKRMAVVPRGKQATTHYSVLESGAGWTMIECRLETGRTHQIRVHMTSLGHALIGDPVYKPQRGAAHLNESAREFPRQALHAQLLELAHPSSGKTMQWRSALPGDMHSLLMALRNA